MSSREEYVGPENKTLPKHLTRRNDLGSIENNISYGDISLPSCSGYQPKTLVNSYSSSSTNRLVNNVPAKNSYKSNSEYVADRDKDKDKMKMLKIEDSVKFDSPLLKEFRRKKRQDPEFRKSLIRRSKARKPFEDEPVCKRSKKPPELCFNDKLYKKLLSSIDDDEKDWETCKILSEKEEKSSTGRQKRCRYDYLCIPDEKWDWPSYWEAIYTTGSEPQVHEEKMNKKKKSPVKKRVETVKSKTEIKSGIPIRNRKASEKYDVKGSKRKKAHVKKRGETVTYISNIKNSVVPIIKEKITNKSYVKDSRTIQLKKKVSSVKSNSSKSQDKSNRVRASLSETTETDNDRQLWETNECVSSILEETKGFVSEVSEYLAAAKRDLNLPLTPQKMSKKAVSKLKDCSDVIIESEKDKTPKSNFFTRKKVYKKKRSVYENRDKSVQPYFLRERPSNPQENVLPNSTDEVIVYPSKKSKESESNDTEFFGVPELRVVLHKLSVDTFLTEESFKILEETKRFVSDVSKYLADTKHDLNLPIPQEMSKKAVSDFREYSDVIIESENKFKTNSREANKIPTAASTTNKEYAKIPKSNFFTRKKAYKKKRSVQPYFLRERPKSHESHESELIATDFFCIPELRVALHKLSIDTLSTKRIKNLSKSPDEKVPEDQMFDCVLNKEACLNSDEQVNVKNKKIKVPSLQDEQVIGNKIPRVLLEDCCDTNN